MRKAKAPEFVSHRDIAGRLGVTAKTVRRWAERGTIPAARFVTGTLLFYRAADFDRYVTTGQWPTEGN